MQNEMMNSFGCQLSINEWFKDVSLKGYILSKVPEEERTLEMCFVAIRYFGAALEFVPDKYKTYELCLDAVRHNIPADEGCSALAFVPEEHKTPELCLEAIKHDYFPPAYSEPDIHGGIHVIICYAPAISYVPQHIRTPKLCFEAIQHFPTGRPGYFCFPAEVKWDFNDDLPADLDSIMPKCVSIQDLLDSDELLLNALKQMGMPDEYISEAKELRENKQFSVS
jgi:hypothetical protein